MRESEFIIWKVESLDRVKSEHPEFTEIEAEEYLMSIANEIHESHPDFFGNFDYRSHLCQGVC